ncbi:unnamed protein product [Aureobasidium uvarum]|uniref:Uncharacterized protein n=1 Tax=Aureobasidium uvarum TaxID=2773716 RepID=A0A9N8PYD9_9PEZI|nr:unnamed protein product [Aureobasidium uvarum]
MNSRGRKVFEAVASACTDSSGDHIISTRCEDVEYCEGSLRSRLNAMAITTSPFITSLQYHALQTWFIAISVSLLLTLYDMLGFSYSSPTKTALYTALICDLCDITIPGSAVGWIPVSSVTVGIASSISSVLVGKDIWERVQQEAKQKEQRKREKAARKVRFDAGTKAGENEKDAVDADKKSNGVVNGGVKALVNVVGDGNGSVKKRAQKA